VIHSMTGFTEKMFHTDSYSVKISVRSLNHRFFDWNFRGNQGRELEDRFRKICQKKIYRGRIEVSVDIDFLDSSKLDLYINEEVLGKILEAFKNISSPGMEHLNLNIENLFHLPHVIQLRRKNFLRTEITFLEEAFHETLGALIKERKREGQALQKQMIRHLRNIERVLTRLERLAKDQPRQIQLKLNERLKELGQNIQASEEKIVAEAAFYAQRYDLSEEIVRLKCHLDRCHEFLLSEKKEAVGKNLDFLAQELFREANTINSKAQDKEIIKCGLIIKGEVESIRQQVQNLE